LGRTEAFSLWRREKLGKEGAYMLLRQRLWGSLKRGRGSVSGRSSVSGCGSILEQGFLRAFTLIELLVVIAIIGVLAGMLFPVFARSREKARQSACMNNEKQIGTAFMQYVEDWDGAIPGYGHNNQRGPYVRVALVPYLQNDEVWVCPSDSDPVGVYTLPNGKPERRSYIPNSQVIGPGDGNALDEADAVGGVQDISGIKEPASTIAIAEKRTGVPDWHLDWPVDLLPPFGGEHSLEKTRHNGGANYIFADGHARWMKFTQTMKPVNLWVRNKKYWANRTWILRDYND